MTVPTNASWTLDVSKSESALVVEQRQPDASVEMGGVSRGVCYEQMDHQRDDEHHRNAFRETRRPTMVAALKLTHRTIGVEVRRGTYDVVLDGERIGSLELNNSFETPVEPGRHTLQIRNGRNSSRTLTFDAAEGEVVAFRTGGKRILPIFLASFVVPSLALSLKRE